MRSTLNAISGVQRLLPVSIRDIVADETPRAADKTRRGRSFSDLNTRNGCLFIGEKITSNAKRRQQCFGNPIFF